MPHLMHLHHFLLLHPQPTLPPAFPSPPAVPEPAPPSAPAHAPTRAPRNPDSKQRNSNKGHPQDRQLETTSDPCVPLRCLFPGGKPKRGQLSGFLSAAEGHRWQSSLLAHMKQPCVCEFTTFFFCVSLHSDFTSGSILYFLLL